MTTLVKDDYLELCSMLRGLTGLDLAQYKRPQMERRIRSFYAQMGVHTLTGALHLLRTNPAHLDELLDRITINVSQLWRNPEQWRVVQDQLLPELANRGQLRAWSAGSSYGAEAYTLAALCHALMPSVRTMITGTDIDRRVVDRARLGLFSDDDARSAPADLLQGGFDRIEGGWRAKLELRAITRFDVDDLVRVRPRAASFDLVLCRNTVIYFAEPLRDEVHARLAHSLSPGGFLVIGSTERVSSPASLGLTMQHPSIYQRDTN